MFSLKQSLLFLIICPQNGGVLKLYLHKPNNGCLSTIFQKFLSKTAFYVLSGDATEALCSR